MTPRGVVRGQYTTTWWIVSRRVWCFCIVDLSVSEPSWMFCRSEVDEAVFVLFALVVLLVSCEPEYCLFI
jgi:hypothetical protein